MKELKFNIIKNEWYNFKNIGSISDWTSKSEWYDGNWVLGEGGATTNDDQTEIFSFIHNSYPKTLFLRINATQGVAKYR